MRRNTRIFSGRVALACAAAMLCSSVPGQAQAPLQALHNHVRPAVSSGQAALVGSLPATQQMNVSIVLPLRNQAGLTALLVRLYDPSSPDYRHFLSVEEFTGQFGPTAEDYQAVVDFARSNGLIVTDTPANRLLVPLSGTVAQIEKAFNVSMKVYRHPTEARTFFSPDREPSLNLSVPVAHIAGLNNFSIPRPMVTTAAAGQAIANVTGSGPGGQYLGSDMRAAYYGGTALTGSGQCVGLFEFDGYNLSDVNLTFSNAGQSYSVPISNVLLDGATGAPLSGNDTEQVVDIVQAIGMAPGLSQVRVYIGNTTNGYDDANIFNAMATENICKQLSVSWGWSPDDPATDDVFFQEFAAQGQSLFVASGDRGAYDVQVNPNIYPAEDAWVTVVGGTSLTTNGVGGPWVSETAWDSPGNFAASGGGISLDAIPIPNWQAGVANASNGGSTTLRNSPDVAIEADLDNYYCAMGTCGEAGGTSFAAPRWAGFMALVNQQAVEEGIAPAGGLGFINPAIYSIGGSSSYASDLHDIASGNDDCCGQPVWYNAVAGYDLVTGWGSPNGQNLIDALAPPPAGPGFTLSASPASLTIGSGASGTATIAVTGLEGFAGNVTLAASNLPGGVTASFSPNPTTGSSVLTLTVSGSAIRGPYLLTVTGTSGAQTAAAVIALMVNAPGFGISALYEATAIWQGSSGANTITVTDYDGFTGSVNLAVSGLPSGVTASFSPNPTTGSSVLTLTASDTAALELFGNSPLTITGTSGALTATCRFYLMVGSPLPLMDLLTIPSTIAQGGFATATITFVPQGDFTGPITLSASALPPGVTATFNPNAIAVGGISVLTLTASPSATLGTYTMQIFGTYTINTGRVQSDEYFLPLTVTATPTPTFTLSLSSAALTLSQGSSATETVTVNYLNGFAGSVDIIFPYGLPNGVTASFSPNPTTGTSTLTVTVSNTALPGFYAVEMAGSSPGTVAPTAWLWIIANPSLGLAPPVGEFGPVNVGTASQASALTFTFNAAETLGSKTVLTQGATGLDFADAGTGTCQVGTAYNTGQTCTVNVTFTPRFAGTRNGAVVLEDGNGYTIATGYVQGTGVGPQVNFLPGEESAVLPAGSYSPAGVAVDGSGNVYIADTLNGQVLKETLSAGSYTQSTVAGSLNNPSGVAVDGSGNVYIADTLNDRVLKETPSAGGYEQSTVASGFNSPYGVAVDGSGNVYIADTGNGTVWKETLSADSYAQSAVASGLNNPYGVAVDGSGNVYIANASGGTVWKEALSAGSYTQSNVASGLGSPKGVAVDGTGNVYITDTPSNTVLKETLLAGGGYVQSAISSSALSLPLGVTVDGSGNVYIADTGNDRVLKEDLSDPPGLSFASTPAGSSSPDSPRTVTVENAGNAALSFPIPPAGDNPAISANFTLNSGAASDCPLVGASSPTAGTLAAGASCQLPIGFAPTAAGALGGSLVLTDNNLNAAAPGYATQTIALSGTATPGFTLSATPASLMIGAGASGTGAIAVNDLGGFAGSVTLAASGLPGGVTASFSPNPTTGSSTLTLTAASTATTGTATVAITGTSGSLTASTAVALTVHAVVTLASSPNPSTFGQPVTLVATVVPSTATGAVQFLDGAAVLGSASLAGGVAQLSLSSLPAGSDSLTAVYGAITSATLIQTVNQATPGVTLASSLNPSTYGQSVTFAATVSPAAATGTVQFLDGTTSLGTAAIASGSASLAISTLAVGAHSITAAYSGDANDAPSTSAALAQTVNKLASSVTLASSANPSTYGQSVTFAATVSPAAATGTVQFLDGTTSLGTAAIASGSAALAISTLAVGAHSITATYSGDANDAPSTSAALAQTVNKLASSVTLASSANPSAFGQSVTFAATVSPAAATGTVQFLDGTTSLGTAAIASGSASLAISTLAVGAHSITAVYSGFANDATSTSAALAQTVNKLASSVTLASSANPSAYGQSVTFAATVSPSAATGTVQFLDGTTSLGTATVVSGSAALAISTLAAGAHSITAAYSGATNYAASTSAALAQTVNKAASSVTLASSMNPSPYGQSVTFTATVSPSAATGTVQFLDGTTSLGTATVASGSASLAISTLAVGSHSITAAYSGATNYAASTSAALAQTVNKAASSVTLTSSANPSTYGQSVTFTATVSPSAATGTVQFLDGTTSLGTATVASGSASLAISTLAVGSHSITGAYSGSANDTTSTSPALAQTVNKAASSVTLTSSANPSTYGQSVTFTATVSPAAATGTVQFLNGTASLGTATIASGSASLAVSTLAVGAHSITAVYGGATDYAASTSAALSQTVLPGAPTKLTATAASSSQINLAWTASPTSGVTYNVYSSTSSGFTPSAANRIATGVTATSYSNTGLSPSTTHYYLVTAQDSAGESAASNQASATTAAGMACHVTYSVTSQWSGGFGTALTIENTGSTAIGGWNLTWTWSGNQQITQSWDAGYTQKGANATLTNESYNATIAPGATIGGIGFNASYSGTNTAPSAFYVNGTLCK